MSSAHEILIGPESQSHQILIFLSPRARPAHQILIQASGYTASGLQITLFFKLLLFAVAGGSNNYFCIRRFSLNSQTASSNNYLVVVASRAPTPLKFRRFGLLRTDPPQTTIQLLLFRVPPSPNNYLVVVVSRASPPR